MQRNKTATRWVAHLGIGLFVMVLGSDAPAFAQTLDQDDSPPPSPVWELVDSLASPWLRELATEVLEGNPEIARARRQAAALAARAPQVRALPDPMVSLSYYVLSPETRVGPQRATVAWQQRFPWLGKLALKEQAALLTAAAAEAEVEALRLEQLTEARRLVHELAFLDAYEAIVGEERSSLARFERASQARYAAGTGLQQESVRIQTQITRIDTRLLEIAEQRARLHAELDRLRGGSGRKVLTAPSLRHGEPHPLLPELDREELQRLALARRPELAAASVRIAAAETRVELAEKGRRPDLTAGLSYTQVGRRSDPLGRELDDNGDDILALTGSMNVPLWRRKLVAGVEEAEASRWVEEEGKRVTVAGIESTIGDLTTRIPLLSEHLELLETVLFKQAREALRSAETAYSTGRLNAVDLLDAEVVLFEVRIAAVRTRTDLAVAWARLEHAVAGPLRTTPAEGVS